MSGLCNARGGGTRPLPSQPLKLGPARGLSARPKHDLHHRVWPGRAVLGPSQNVVPWAEPSCLGLHGHLYKS